MVKRFYWAESSHARRVALLERLSDSDMGVVIDALSDAGWKWNPCLFSFLNENQLNKGWWTHLEKLPYERGEARECFADARTVFVLYSGLNLDSVFDSVSVGDEEIPF